MGRAVSRARGAAAITVAVLGLAAPAFGQAGSCTRFNIESLSIGSSLGLVRSRLGREGVAATLVRDGRPDTTSVEYVVGDRTIYIEYDHRIDRKPEAKVALLRTAIQPSEEAIQGLVRRFGPPTVGPAEGSQDPVVWLDTPCGVAATVYRRAGSWWSGDVGTFLQLDTMEVARAGLSPASPYLAGAPAVQPEAAERTVAADGAAAAGVAAVAASDPPAPTPAPTDGVPSDGSVPPPVSDPPPAPSDPAPAITPPETAVQAAEPDALPGYTPSTIAFDRLPERIAAAPPVYPANLRLMGVKGRVELALTVRVDGTVGDVRVVKADPPGRGFEPAAMAAVKRWRYRPATLRSVPTEAEVAVVIEFK
jgi:TonB family protein